MKKGTAFRNIGHKNECSFRCLINLVLSHLHFKIYCWWRYWRWCLLVLMSEQMVNTCMSDKLTNIKIKALAETEEVHHSILSTRQEFRRKMRECCSVKFSCSPRGACPLSLSWRLYVARILIYYKLLHFFFIAFKGHYAFGGSINCLWCHVFLGGVNRHVVTWDARKTSSRLRRKGKRRKRRHGFNGAKAENYRLHLYRLAKVCKGQRLGLVFFHVYPDSCRKTYFVFSSPSRVAFLYRFFVLSVFV